jgi:hypothetical protein
MVIIDKWLLRRRSGKSKKDGEYWLVSKGRKARGKRMKGVVSFFIVAATLLVGGIFL